MIMAPQLYPDRTYDNVSAINIKHFTSVASCAGSCALASLTLLVCVRTYMRARFRVLYTNTRVLIFLILLNHVVNLIYRLGILIILV